MADCVYKSHVAQSSTFRVIALTVKRLISELIERQITALKTRLTSEVIELKIGHTEMFLTFFSNFGIFRCEFRLPFGFGKARRIFQAFCEIWNEEKKVTFNYFLVISS